MRQEKEIRPGAGMSVGSATLVMVFSVLCLTVFAVLSVVTVGSAWTLAEKSADAVTNYYTADCIAVEYLNEITQNYQQNGSLELPTDCEGLVERGGGQWWICYWVPIDEQQLLSVQLTAYDNQSDILVEHWQVEYSGSWTADQTITIWDGTWSDDETLTVWDGTWSDDQTLAVWGG